MSVTIQMKAIERHNVRVVLFHIMLYKVAVAFISVS